jgi:hypothetical protein
MTTIRRDPTHHVPVVGLAVALALIAAVSYVLIDLDILKVGNGEVDQARSGIIYVAAAAYFLGGLMIPLRNRALWIAGAVFNALVILFFLQLYQTRPSVMLSPGGVISKAAQLLLEASLIYLIISDWHRSHHARHSGDRR